MASPEPAKGPSATFVFQGTIKKLKSATMPNVPVDDLTAVVHVDQVLESPANLTHLAGSDITVRLTERAAAGVSLLFHASGWMFGSSVAVRAVTQEAVQAVHAPLLARGGDPAAHRAARQIEQRVADADLVVSGTVVSVQLPPESTPVARGVRAAGDVRETPVSEHDPKWREAVVEIADVHKGEHATKQVSVLFPASQDVRWHKAPKFHAGQQGFFVLHKHTINASDRVDTRTRGAVFPAAEERPVEVYTALSPEDFHPYERQERIRALLDAAPGTRSGKEK